MFAWVAFICSFAEVFPIIGYYFEVIICLLGWVWCLFACWVLVFFFFLGFGFSVVYGFVVAWMLVRLLD